MPGSIALSDERNNEQASVPYPYSHFDMWTAIQLPARHVYTLKLLFGSVSLTPKYRRNELRFSPFTDASLVSFGPVLAGAKYTRRSRSKNYH